MKGQNAWGCASVIGFPLATAGQVHGCPFRTMDKPMLSKVLQHWEVPVGDIEDITKKASDKHYQLACKSYFCKTHPNASGEGVGNHPNHFFNESVNFWNPEAKAKQAAGAKSSGGAREEAMPMEVS